MKNNHEITDYSRITSEHWELNTRTGNSSDSSSAGFFQKRNIKLDYVLVALLTLP